MNNQLTTGGIVRHTEVYHPDFAFITTNRRTGKAISATRVPKEGNGVKQYIKANRVKQEARHKLTGNDYVFIKGIKRGHTRQISTTKPEGERGWNRYADFSKLTDDDCNITPRNPVTYEHDGVTHENALWEGSGDSYSTPAELLAELADHGASLALYHRAHTAWSYWPNHAHREALDAIKKAMG